MYLNEKVGYARVDCVSEKVGCVKVGYVKVGRVKVDVGFETAGCARVMVNY